MSQQSSLGSKVVHRLPNYDGTKLGRVTSVRDYDKWGRIEVIFLDHGQPVPVWVVGSIDRKPVEGDQVLISYIDGRKDAPYLIGFVKNNSYTTNFVRVSKDEIRVQLPVFDIGVRNGKAHNDTKEHLLNDSKKPERAYVELTKSHILLHYPIAGQAPATIRIDKNGFDFFHPTGNAVFTLPNGVMVGDNDHHDHHDH